MGSPLHKLASVAPWALLATLGLSGCVTKVIGEIIAPVEIGADGTPVVFQGAPPEIRSDVARNVRSLLEQFVETGKRSLVDDAAYDAELFLKQRGYAAAEVRYEITGESTALIDVHAGQRSTIGRVLIESNEGCPMPPEELRLYVNGPRTGLLGTGAMLYVEDRVAQAAGRVRDDLISTGFLDAEASLEDPGPRAEGGAVDVLLKVHSGRHYVVKSAAVRLHRTSEPISPELERNLDDALQHAVTTADGSPRRFEPRLQGGIRTVLADILSQGGYPDATLTIERTIDRDSKEVVLDVVAEPGPYVRLAEVRFEGNERTRASFIASRLLLGTGDPYDALKVRDTVRGLYRTGLFSQVSPRLTGEGDARDLTIDLVEQPSREVFIEPGFGSYEQARITLGARDRNLVGKGIAGSTEVTVAMLALRAEASLTDPWLFRRDLIGDLRLEYDRREEPSFTRESPGAGAFITKEWTDATATTIGYRLSRSEASDIEAIEVNSEEQDDAVRIAGVILTQRYDIRDALFAPSAGHYVEASVEVATEAIGSELSFIRPKLTAAWFRSMGADDVVGLGFRMGIIAPAYDDTSIPIQERYFAGGENSVRSFRESELGPVDVNGEPLGGEGFASASLEWRHELGGAFQSAAFIDAGLVETEARRLTRFNNVRMGVGVGLRYLLPIGPLRIDAALNPDRRSGESEWVVHFGIGMPF